VHIYLTLKQYYETMKSPPRLSQLKLARPYATSDKKDSKKIVIIVYTGDAAENSKTNSHPINNKRII